MKPERVSYGTTSHQKTFAHVWLWGVISSNCMPVKIMGLIQHQLLVLHKHLELKVLNHSKKCKSQAWQFQQSCTLGWDFMHPLHSFSNALGDCHSYQAPVTTQRLVVWWICRVLTLRGLRITFQYVPDSASTVAVKVTAAPAVDTAWVQSSSFLLWPIELKNFNRLRLGTAVLQGNSKKTYLGWCVWNFKNCASVARDMSTIFWLPAFLLEGKNFSVAKQRTRLSHALPSAHERWTPRSCLINPFFTQIMLFIPVLCVKINWIHSVIVEFLTLLSWWEFACDEQ